MTFFISSTSGPDGANFGGAIFDAVDLRGLEFTTARLPRHIAKLERELRDILADHVRWLNSGGKDGEQANLSEVNMGGLDLSSVNLSAALMSYSILKDAELRNGNFMMTDFTFADMRACDLSGSDLRGAKLQRANLTGAILTGARFDNLPIGTGGGGSVSANLQNAKLRGAKLAGADLSNANLEGCDFTKADLRHADLRGAALTDADFTDALIDGAKLVQPHHRFPAANDAALLLRSCLDADMLGRSSFVDVLFTKWDVVARSADVPEIEQFIAAFTERTRQHCEPRLGRLRFFRLAARPSAHSSLAFAHGLSELFASWMEDSPAFRAPSTTPIRVPEHASEFDRYLWRQLPALRPGG